MPGAGHATRRWGFHRLDSRWAARIVAAAELTPNDLVLDIGAGDGALTAPIAATGARVVAFELHPTRAAALRERFAHDRRVRVVRADAADLWLPRQPFRVVANPPFGVTTAVLRRLVSPGSRLVRADLVLPRTDAKRWEKQIAGARFERALPRGAFTPPAPMDVGVLVIERRSPAARVAATRRAASGRSTT